MVRAIVKYSLLKMAVVRSQHELESSEQHIINVSSIPKLYPSPDLPLLSLAAFS